MTSVGTHIRRLRTAKHMTQEQPAETLFVPRQAVSAWETACRMWRLRNALPPRWAPK